jgi:hypothetical protein
MIQGTVASNNDDVDGDVMVVANNPDQHHHPYRSICNTEKGKLLEDSFNQEFQEVIKKYERVTGKKHGQNFWYTENGGNRCGYDGYLWGLKPNGGCGDDDYSYHLSTATVELKNLESHYTIPVSWIRSSIVQKEKARVLKYDSVFLVVTGGKLGDSSIEYIQQNQRIKLRQIPNATIRNKGDVQKNKKLRRRLRAICWEICEEVFGKVLLPNLELLSLLWASSAKVVYFLGMLSGAVSTVVLGRLQEKSHRCASKIRIWDKKLSVYFADHLSNFGKRLDGGNGICHLFKDIASSWPLKVRRG